MVKRKSVRVRELIYWSLGLLERGINNLFTHPVDRFSWWLNGLVIAGLMVGGIRIWGIFFNWGNLSFDFLDWAEVTGPRYALLRDAAQKGVLPLHAGNITALRGVTDRYFSIADTPFSPQYLLLKYIDIGQYIFFDTLLFYLIGFVGLLIIYRQYRLSPFAFSLLFILFNFNGNIISHLAVGHSIWTGHFLIPYFVILVLNLIRLEKIGWGWVLSLCMVGLAILAQGYFHLYIWCLLYLGLLAIINWRLLKPVIIGGFFAGIVALPRLLPPSLSLPKITHKFLGGFSSVTDMVAGMVILRDPDRTVGELTDTFPLNAWETDYYIGLLGFVFLVIFGVVLPLRANRTKVTTEVQVLLASLVFSAFSLGKVFGQIIRIFPLPPLTGERVTSRMFILPFVFVLILAVIYLQRELSKRSLPTWGQITLLGVAGLLFHDLGQHLSAWRIRFLDALVYIYPKIPFDPAEHYIINHQDPIYTGMLIWGSVVAGGVILFLVIFALRKRSI